ncbi:bifunctional diaminohydroxyphosphoribosylaminopyrimidine deaminase/5-amino-6-(5-phosphoribosylamino)uracil reductase RibD [bacterium]|nr:bifunctional diaminohydroxyphosphoribosylaminopyrimidine deaminase/5-amino-6-(5-phosphoribosylamino)uracil reductase RibD [bacterium]
MKRAIALARNGTGNVSPNPRVGAIIVRNSAVIAEGFHAFFGGFHAERAALQSLDDGDARNATLIVNLEPCSHHGKTPPCTQAIIDAGIGRVVYGLLDPNPLVSGRGIRQLKNAGVEVIGPVLSEACMRLNAGFIKSIRTGKPYITLKIAQTLDGRIALPNGQSRWITCAESRKAVHLLRSEHDAVLIGINTALQDDPRLTVRAVPGPSPKRIVLDSALRIPHRLKLIRNHPEKTWIVASENSDKTKQKNLKDLGVHLILVPEKNGFLQVESAWKSLIKQGICSILVEGGRNIFSYFFEINAMDEVHIFIAPKVFGKGIQSIEGLNITDPQKAVCFKKVSWEKSGTDMLFKGENLCLQDLLKKLDASAASVRPTRDDA